MLSKLLRKVGFKGGSKVKKILTSLFIVTLLIFSTCTFAFADTEINVDNVPDISSTATDSTIFDNFKKTTKEEFIAKIDSGLVVTVVKNTTSNEFYYTTTDNQKFWYTDVDGDLSAYLAMSGIDISSKPITTILNNDTVEEKKKEQDQSNMITGFIIGSLIMLGCCLYFKNRQQSAVPVGGNIQNQAGQKEDVPTVKFSDVEGVEGLKNDVMRVVDSLKHPEKYKAMGARPTKGIILYGPPGTGKTLLAKAIAGEAGVPFFSAVGSDFVEKYVGVGASRVRELYKKARKAAPCIVFIDEVDAVAAQRGQDNNSEADQTINALLAELDGFSAGAGIVTICATNRLDLLDSAFKRAGRFDLKLAVGLPDKKGREKILKIHGANKKFAPEIDFGVVADKTVGFSGAELESLLNEAALIAVDKNSEHITYEDIDDAFFKLVMQGNKKPREEIDETTRVVAWHEAGHTLATKLLTNDQVPSVTIIGSTSGAGGVTFRNPEETMLQSKKYLRNNVKIMYAGRAAEQLYFKDDDKITTGASQDIRQATQVLKEYLALYGMGELGMIDLTQFKREFGEIINEASNMSKALYSETVQLLEDNKETLELLASELIRKETLTEAEIDEIIFLSK